jgi:predicted amidohydrolase
MTPSFTFTVGRITVGAPILAALILITPRLGRAEDGPASLHAVDRKVDRDFVKIAAVQISGYDKGDARREDYEAANDLAPYIERAGKDGAQLVVFPEYILGRIKVPGPTTQIISKAAAAQGIYVIVGCWELYDDATFANTALVFDRTGRITGRYKKTHAAVDHFEGTPAWSRPPSGKSPEWFLTNDPEWIMNRGEDLPVFEFDFGKVGILTCYDGWFPEPFNVLSLKGAELIVWINGRGGSVEDFIMKTVMFQSHVAMVSVNQAYGSGTMIGDPAAWPARILARCPDKIESYIAATIDLKSVRRTRASSRNFQQRRPDLYKALLDPVPTEPHTALSGGRSE